MRTISISTDVYAAIWAARKPGEDSEDAILRRILNVPEALETAPKPRVKQGFADPRFGVSVPEGFEIFRVYKGQVWKAVARDGQWWVEGDPLGYKNLNQLSRKVTGGLIENAWRGWYYMLNGERQLVWTLRRDYIGRRRVTPKTAEEVGFG